MRSALLSLSLWLTSLNMQAQAAPSYAGKAAKALYLITNRVGKPNSVIALALNKNGEISAMKETATGGMSGALVADDGVTPVPFDALQSEDAVIVSGNSLYVVNAGSSSLSSFAIDPKNPLNLTPRQAPIKLVGDYPVAVAVSEAQKLVCVATAGAKNGVECLEKKGEYLQHDRFGLRSFGIQQQNPPFANKEGVSDIFFSSDNKWLYAPVKGTPTGSTGFLAVFPVHNYSVSPTQVQSTSSEQKFLYGGVPNPKKPNQAFITDVAEGAVIYEIDSTGKGKIVSKGTPSPAVAATCWGYYSEVTKSVWVTSVLSQTLVEMDLNTAAQLGQYNVTLDQSHIKGGPSVGFLETVVPADYLYGLAVGDTNNTQSGIAVIDVSKKSGKVQAVQYYAVPGLDNYAHGLAYWA